METRLTLSDEACALLVDLLEQERQEIHGLIHHSAPASREELRRRLQIVEEVLDRILAHA